jgi:hypothetical protein
VDGHKSGNEHGQKGDKNGHTMNRINVHKNCRSGHRMIKIGHKSPSIETVSTEENMSKIINGHENGKTNMKTGISDIPKCSSIFTVLLLCVLFVGKAVSVLTT